MDYISLFIGLVIGIALQRFFNVTKHVAAAIKNYQQNQKSKKVNSSELTKKPEKSD